MKTVRTKPSPAVSALLDRAESLRRAGKIGEGLRLVEELVRQNPEHPRALLLQSRLMFERGRLSQALEVLQALGSVPGRQEELRALRKGLDHLARLEASGFDPAFATESMARLLVQQGYLLEGMEIYRRLFLASEREERVWEEMLRLRERVEREGSREAPKERVEIELPAWDRWLGKRQRGS